MAAGLRTVQLGPDGSGCFRNDAFSTRTGAWDLDATQPDEAFKEDQIARWAEAIPAYSAYAPTREAKAAERACWREGSWTDIAPYGEGGMAPERLFPVVVPDWYPTGSSRRAAVDALPYLRSDRFVEHRVDPGIGQEFLLDWTPARPAALGGRTELRFFRDRRRVLHILEVEFTDRIAHHLTFA